jgi:RES domain-containing protein
MIVYRISITKHANDLSGEGARLNGGRWNNKLIPCTYTAESRALAVLEYTVNVNIDEIPRALSLVLIEIPDKNILKLNEANLPGNWKQSPTPSSTRQFGTSLLTAAKNAVIKIQSAVIPQEFNYILNPAHPDSKNFKILDIQDFVFDVRIKLK